MKNEKDNNLSSQSIRQLEVLGKYYEIDHKNKIVKIPFHYKKVSDLIDTHIVVKENPVFKNDLLKDISYLLHRIPDGYKIDVDLHIDDYEGYSPELISGSITDWFEMFHYDVMRKNKEKSSTVIKLVLIGILSFSLLLFMNAIKWFNVGVTQDELRNQLLSV